MIESERKTETRQVVFLVDTTAGLAPYWDIFKRNYIQPAVAFFSSMANPQVGQISNTLFSLVVYGSSDTFGGPYNRQGLVNLFRLDPKCPQLNGFLIMHCL